MAMTWFSGSTSSPEVEKAVLDALEHELEDEKTLNQHKRGHLRRDPIYFLRLNRIDRKVTFFGVVLVFDTFINMATGAPPAWHYFVALLGGHP